MLLVTPHNSICFRGMNSEVGLDIQYKPLMIGGGYVYVYDNISKDNNSKFPGAATGFQPGGGKIFRNKKS